MMNKAKKQPFVNKRVLRSKKTFSKIDAVSSRVRRYNKSNCVLSVDDHCDNNNQSSEVENHYNSSKETYGNNIKVNGIKCPDIKNSTRLSKKYGTGLEKLNKAIPVPKVSYLNNNKMIDKPASSYNLRNKKKN